MSEQTENKLLTSVRYPLMIGNGMAANEDTMDENKPPKRQMTRLTRSARDKRIVERLREGFGYDEIAREERLTGRRVRQIVKQAMEGREALESAIHAHMQIDRLGQAMRVAGDALAQGDIRAVAPFIKALEKLDRYQSLAREAAPRQRRVTANDSLVMKTFIDRIRRQVLDECRREAAETTSAPAAPAPALDAAVASPVSPELHSAAPAPAWGEAPAAIAPPPLVHELQPAVPPPDPNPGMDGASAAGAPRLAGSHPVSPWGTWAR
jgi:hypothetical protein